MITVYSLSWRNVEGRAMCEAEKWQWQFSRYDDRVHAFPTGERPASFVEAACTHSVPFDKVIRTHEGTRCLACLLIVGDRLARQHRGLAAGH